MADDTDRIEAHGLQVARPLKLFLDEDVLPGSGVDPDDFWAGFAGLVATFTPRNRELLATRERLQQAIDEWYVEHRDGSREGDTPLDGDDHLAFLRDLGYLVDEPDDFTVDTTNIDPEIADIAGPQLVVPVTNARYAINAANARWGSLYDALYGTDAMGDAPPAGPYDTERGERVMAWGRAFLDDTFPLADGSHADATAYRVADGALVVDRGDADTTGLADPDQFAGHAGEAHDPTAVLLTNHRLRVEVSIDPDDDIGATDAAQVADLVMEAAVSVIMDCEDSVACVDGEDKTVAYRNWLGLQRGDLTTPVTKAAETFTRTMDDDRHYTAPDGSDLVVHGRGLQLVRTVGHLMTTPAVLDPDGDEVFEGLVDAMVTIACALHDLRRGDRDDDTGRANSRAGSVYLVKPKMHGPDEVAFTDDVLSHVEQVLGLEPNTVKVGIMDEERRTSANLAACIDAARHRVAFINTGFLDRTGDEFHTAMEAGAMVPKTTMKDQDWIGAYEDRNVDIGLACGLRGRAQIGKGMWAAPNRMAAMLDEKVGHPRSGANCAWVPSPTAATLHAIHYHRVDVAARQDELAGSMRHDVGDLLTLPLQEGDLVEDARVAELENNAQGILGYVVRWVDQGVGCSTVPDINGVGLMEDRATCRISSQALANWLHHGLTDPDELQEVFRRMALVVDEQNADDPAYTPMAPTFDGPAFTAATALAFEGREQPSGYTEPILHAHRARAKAGIDREPSA